VLDPQDRKRPVGKTRRGCLLSASPAGILIFRGNGGGATGKTPALERWFFGRSSSPFHAGHFRTLRSNLFWIELKGLTLPPPAFSSPVSSSLRVGGATFGMKAEPSLS